MSDGIDIEAYAGEALPDLCKALAETRADLAAGRTVSESAEAHLVRLDKQLGPVA